MAKFLQSSSVEKLNQDIKKITSIDYFTLVLITILTISGIVWILDASAVLKSNNEIFYSTYRQIFFVFIGSVLAFFAFKYYELVHKKIIYLVIFITILLILVLTPGISNEVNGATRWIKIGGVDIQPTEFAKPILIIYFASLIAKFNKNISVQKFTGFTSKFKYYFVELWFPIICIISVFCGLILLQKDLGSVIVICLTCIGIFFTASKSYLNKFFILLLILILGLTSIFSISAYSYRLNRFNVYKELIQNGNLENMSDQVRLGEGYQLEQILIAVGSGGWSGVGFTASKQKYNYLVDQTSYTDTIFAVIAEETGMIGAGIYILLYLLIIWRGMKVSSQINDTTYQYICYGIIYMIGIQSLFNISANLSIVPLKGLTLPFLSYGGSSIISLLISIGIYLKLSKYRELEN